MPRKRGIGVLTLTSTFLRCEGDNQPDCIRDLCAKVVGMSNIAVLAPHAVGAEEEENLAEFMVRHLRYGPVGLG